MLETYDYNVSNNKRFLGCDAREVVEVVASSWYMSMKKLIIFCSIKQEFSIMF